MQDLARQYSYEVEKIECERLKCWSSIAEDYEICNLPVKRLTIKAWVDLQIANNSFVNNKTPLEKDYFTYIWRNSFEYQIKGKQLKKYLLKKKIKKIPRIELFLSINNHINEAFNEFPETASNGSYSRSTSITGIDPLTCAVDEISFRYGINPIEVVEWPISRVFMLQKSIRATTIPNYKPLAPKSIRLISSEILKNLNNGQTRRN